MELKELIVKRKSIRKYDITELDGAELNQIADFIGQLKPLIEDCGSVGFRIVNRAEFFEKTRGMFRIDAPHYVLLFGDGSDAAYKNIGYSGELIALELTKMGYGTCWLGGAKSAEMEDCGDYAISIAFGKPLVAFRQSADQAKRRDLKDIAEGYSDAQREVLEFIRLAPSAVNLQPWYFKCEPDKIHIFRTKSGGLFKVFAGKGLSKMQKIDIGIAIAHFNVLPFAYKELEVSQDVSHKGKDKGMIYEGTICF